MAAKRPKNPRSRTTRLREQTPKKQRAMRKTGDFSHVSVQEKQGSAARRQANVKRKKLGLKPKPGRFK